MGLIPYEAGEKIVLTGSEGLIRFDSEGIDLIIPKNLIGSSDQPVWLKWCSMLAAGITDEGISNQIADIILKGMAQKANLENTDKEKMGTA
jgi:hypothetical protein